MKPAMLALALPALVFAQAPAPKAPEAGSAKAELKVGLAIEKSEVKEPSEDLKVAADTKIYVGARISGITDGSATVVFEKDGKEVSKVELKVPHSPYRTNAYRTFRAKDGGDWSAKVLGADGAELGSVKFKVEITK